MLFSVPRAGNRAMRAGIYVWLVILLLLQLGKNAFHKK
jgi:hypothetical protein